MVLHVLNSSDTYPSETEIFQIYMMLIFQEMERPFLVQKYERPFSGKMKEPYEHGIFSTCYFTSTVYAQRQLRQHLLDLLFDA